MTFHIVTIFPNIFDSYLKEGLLKRAREKGLIEIKIHNLRDFTDDKRKTVDDKPFGGGPGMVLKVGPIYKAVQLIKSKIQNPKSKQKVILLSAKGRKFNQKMAYQLSEVSNLILICGRYEGVDERVAKYIADKEISIGDYILSGGELAAMVIIEAITRLIPGTLGNKESIEERRFEKTCKLSNLQTYKLGSYPVYTRPEIFEPKLSLKWKVPKILLSGNHKKIEEWRKNRRVKKGNKSFNT